MKVVGLVICFMCVPLQISGSFYDELHTAMQSVQHGFGKLLSDVVYDVTDTVHCTISAVEHVLTLNGLIRTKSVYGHKCKDGPPPPKDTRDDDDPLQKFLRTRNALEEQTFGDQPTQLHSSIANVNKTLNHALDNHESQRKIESISRVLKDETEQLTKVSNMLRQELNSISRNVNTELDKFEKDMGPSVWEGLEMGRNHHELNLRQTIPANTADTKNTEVKETNNVQNSFDDAEKQFERLIDDVDKIEPNQFPKNFRDVTRNILDMNREENPKPKKPKTGSVFNVDEGNFDQFSPFFDPETSKDDKHKKVLEDTVNIMKDSEYNQQIMDSIFKQSRATSDVFGANPRLFNF